MPAAPTDDLEDMMNLEYGFKVYATIFAAMVPSALLRGYVLATLWRWFVVPLGMPAIGWAHAYGGPRHCGRGRISRSHHEGTRVAPDAVSRGGVHSGAFRAAVRLRGARDDDGAAMSLSIDERFADFKNRYAQGKTTPQHQQWYNAVMAVEAHLFPEGVPAL